MLAVYEKLAAADALCAQRNWSGLQGAEPAVVSQARTELWAALTDDFATPRALAALSEPIAALAQALTQPKAAESAAVISHVRAFVREAGAVLGVFQHDPQTVIDAIVEGAREQLFPTGSDKRAAIEALVAEREAARQAKDWARADELRVRLTAEGVEVRDTKQGPIWRPVLAVAQTAEASA